MTHGIKKPKKEWNNGKKQRLQKKKKNEIKDWKKEKKNAKR